MRTASFISLLCLMPVLVLLFGPFGRAESGELVLERTLVLPEGEEPRPSTADGDPRPVLFSGKIPTPSGAPAIVVARSHEVCYFDSGDLSLIRRNTYRTYELICVSRDGAFIAVYRTNVRMTSQETLHLVRVETWEGEEVWEKAMNLGRVGGFEPTVTGGLIVYPSADMSSDPPPRSGWKSVPPHTPNGLMIFGADGELLLEDPAWAHLALDYEGALSEDGRYLVFAYGWNEAERRKSSDLILYGDKACLALYDTAAGIKLWSHCFEDVLLGRLALDASADKIVCFEAGLSERSPTFHFSTFLAFDREGRQIASRTLAEPGQLFSDRWTLLSPNGRYCGFTVSHFQEVNSPKVYVLDTSSGDVVWEFSCPEGFYNLFCKAVNDDGCALVAARRDGPDGVENHLLFVDRGSAHADFDLGELGKGKPPPQVFMPRTGHSVWLLQGRNLSLYTTGDLCTPEAEMAE